MVEHSNPTDRDLSEAGFRELVAIKREGIWYLKKDSFKAIRIL